MGNLILFDIDGTMFNPQRFGQLIRSEFVKILSIEEEELIRANADYYSKLEVSTDFEPRDIVTYISGRFNIGREALDNVFWGDDKIYKESFFPEVHEVLKTLAESHTLGIFSQGNDELQARKLEAGGVRRYFSDEYIFIHSRKLTDEVLEKIPQNSTVIDDNHEVIKRIASITTPIWMNRLTPDSDPNIRTIHNLEELLQ